MTRASILLVLLPALLLAGCVSFAVGRRFPSPDPGSIKIGVTDRASLQQVFGEPYQVGLDSGDQTWRWFYGERSGGTETSKDFNVRFNPDGTVKSYSFTSNFPEDMKRLR